MVQLPQAILQMALPREHMGVQGEKASGRSNAEDFSEAASMFIPEMNH